MITVKSFTKTLLGATAAVVLTTAAYAADTVVYEQPPEAPIVVGFDWTGFYAGAHGGFAWADRDWDGEFIGIPVDDELFDYDMDGALVGAQIGYNWQINNFVLGVEADASWADVHETEVEFGFLSSTEVEASVEWLATIRGRAGFAWDRFMFYGTGGIAFAGVDTDANRSSIFFGTVSDSGSATHTGWAAGVGVEAMVTEKISLKAEYLHADFDDEDFDYNLVPISSADDTIGSADLDIDIVRIGVNFHF